jgi:hypothetical protein
MKRATEQPLTKLADAAFRQAAQKVIERAEASGTPVIVWEDGEVKELDVRGGRLKAEPDKRKGGRPRTIRMTRQQKEEGR